MTSRRPMTRSFSGNGRSSSFNNEDEISSSNGRSESRNPYLSNVRPENRSTLCSVMAQLTDDIQPSFDITLKSKAVSETCNVKFTCVVSGYPAPELTWYKDDMEMDRYCGLPKYEIGKNGKTHTLHIYNCTVDDAAIYQASACNSKGIVSCSGVLEVGTMSEYKIHQRFFAKLKQKAENKKRELEESRKRGKENVRSSPDRSQRKRRSPEEAEPPKTPRAPQEEAQVADVVERPTGISVEPNGVSAEASKKDLELDSEKVETKNSTIETLAKKKSKVSNGIDSGAFGSNHTVQGNGGENSYDGGLSLAQFLAETLHSQVAEDKQNLARLEKTVQVDNSSADVDMEKETETQKEKQEKERALAEEQERKRIKERDLEMEKQREKEKECARQREMLQRTTRALPSGAKLETKAHKESDHHNIQASLSSVLHSVKDFFFGKNKKGHSHDEESSEEKERDFPVAPKQPYPSPPPHHPQELFVKPEVYEPPKEEAVPLEVNEPQKAPRIVVSDTQPVSLEQLTPDEPNHMITIPHTEDEPKTFEIPLEDVADFEEKNIVDMCLEVGSDRPQNVSLSVLPSSIEVANTNYQTVPVSKVVVPNPHEVNIPVLSLELDHKVERGETQAAPKQDPCEYTPSPESTQESGWHMSNPTTVALSGSLPDCSVFFTDSHETIEMEVKEMHVDENIIVSDYEIRENHSQSIQDKGEKVMEEIQPWPHVEDGIQMIDSETPALIVPTIESIEPEQLLLVLGKNVLIQSQEECITENSKSHCSKTDESVSVSQKTLEETPIFEECIGNGDYNFIEDATPVLRESEEESILKAETQLPVVTKAEEKADDLYMKNMNIQGMNKVLTFKNEKAVESEELEGQTKLDVQYKSSNHLETQPEIDNVSMHDEISLSSSVSRPADNTSHLGGFTENIPEIRIFDSVMEDLSEVKQNEFIAIPSIEIIKSEVGELIPSKPFSLTDSESEHAIFLIKEERDASETEVKTTAMSPVFVGVSPTEERMQDNELFSAAKNVQEVEQQDEKTLTLIGEKPNNLPSASLSVMNQWIPTINISCTDGFKLTDDDDDHSLAKPSAFDGPLPHEGPQSPMFVVPPISVSVCEDIPSETKLPPTIENSESESLLELLRGVESDLEKITTIDTDKCHGDQKQDTETEKERKSNNIPSFSCKTAEVVSIIPSLSKATDKVSITASDRVKPTRETKTEPEIDGLVFKNPTPPMMSPASLRRFLAKAAPTTDSTGGMAVPAITVGDSSQSDKTGDELSGGSTPTSSLSCESSPRLKRRDSLSQIRSATPEELASGARRKIFIPKTQGVEGESAMVGPGVLDVQCKKETPYMSPSQARRAAFLQASAGSQTPPLERRSPLLARRKTTLDVPRVLEETTVEEPENPANETKPVEKEKLNPFKAPQVIRKIRGELFTDVSGHLKLWCQFFNVLSDSTIKWYRDEEEIVEVQRSGGDESQVALAIVQASSRDCGVYGCTIKNEYGTDSTDFLLSVDILSELLLRDDSEVGEEIEMTPLTFSKGLADSGLWGDKFFGRIMTEEAHLGEGCKHKASRVKVIYGLDPVFESGSTCIMKVQNPIAYGTKEESNLMERNLEITKQECRIQNMVREYCKIFAAEARVIETFGFALEVIPQYLMYRPANSVPYATVEADVNGVYLKYCLMDAKGRLITRTISEVEQKCCTFQHWIHQWTHGNLLITQLEGVGMKITNVRVATKSKGYQGLTDNGSPNVFEQFLTQHQCNYYCGLLGLRSLKVMDSLQQPLKIKGSRSPLLHRKLGQGSSPQIQRKGLGSPQTAKKATSSPVTVRKTNSSPTVVRKMEETEDNPKTVEISKDVTIR
ncbi:alpha-protein kinase 3 isoform X2 [Hypomesus transpacificus]|uniref:alpha-protein kinase 3 isoform X2 n=1 Tax=Hypomesus transpacificus TaxID=137520 RepID=UPI001F087167|nr:alpha-protein kinase 3 isoform X2 [Hypomesus transpacificus]